MSKASVEGSSLRAERVLPATPREVFAAFERADLLARWWGPEGFTITIERFAFEPGEPWVFVMHGPDGRSYPSESVFRSPRATKAPASPGSRPSRATRSRRDWALSASPRTSRTSTASPRRSRTRGR